jgi:hypothetical protein
MHGRGVALACALAAVLAAGCSSGDKPVALPSLSPSSSPSASPSPMPSSEIVASVTAVVKDYYRLLNEPTTVENGQALAGLMTPNCTCRRVATSTIDVAKKHQTYFGVTKVVSITPVVDGPTVADALVQYDYGDSGIKDAHGRVISRSAGRRGSKLLFYFALVSGTWRISQVRSISNGQPA